MKRNAWSLLFCVGLLGGCHSATTKSMPPDLAPDLNGAGPDLNVEPDFLPPADLQVGAPAAPRLIAPLSTSTVTQREPTLRWVLAPGVGAPVVDLCQDRACTLPLTIPVTIEANQTSGIPTSALPSGWVFWRVRVVSGSQTATSATWQLWVGKTSASNPVDTSSGTILDVNGDGYPDILVGAPGANIVHLYLGNGTTTLPSPIALTNPDAGPSTTFGRSVASAGDVNGDGYADFLIADYTANGDSGVVHLYLGAARPSTGIWNGPTPLKRTDLVSPAGGTSLFGFSVAAVADVNGDGYGDFLIGANLDHVNGAAYLYLGEATIPGLGQGVPTPSPAPDDDWNGAAPPRRLVLLPPDSDGTSEQFATAVAGAGDVNGDGYADFLIAAPNANAELGSVHLYLGEATLSAADWNGAAPPKRSDLASPDGVTSLYGESVAGAGDVNGDGFSDFVIGAEKTNSAHLYLGAATIPGLGQGAPSPTPVPTAWNGAAPVGRFDLVNPDGANAQFGGSAAGAGDVNGDGFADFLVGARGASKTTGAAHLFLGGATLLASNWNAPSPVKRVDPASPDGASSFGAAVAAAGDINADGFADFLVGAPGANSSAGAAHVYFGAAAIPSPPTEWNGGTATQRTDLAGSDGAGASYGTSLASARHFGAGWRGTWRL